MIDLDGLAEDGFGHWFAGFVDGEGCFDIQIRSDGTIRCALIIQLRLDDLEILQVIQRRLGRGSIRFPKRQGGPNHRPQARWVVSSKGPCADVVRVLRGFPLRAKKRRDFDTWARAVEAWQTAYRGQRSITNRAYPIMATCAQTLRADRRFPDPDRLTDDGQSAPPPVPMPLFATDPSGGR